jgi:hypothetical protein
VKFLRLPSGVTPGIWNASQTKHSHQVVAGKAFQKFYEIPEDMWGRRYKAEPLSDNMLAVNLVRITEDP